MDVRQTAVLMLAVGALLDSVNSQTVCSPGWFGSLCQYKCRCSINNCTTEGACGAGVPCEKGWFGPACQYVDLAYRRTSGWNITDGDDETCIAASKATRVSVTLDQRYYVTWLRVRLSKPDLLFNLKIYFRQDASLSCTNTRTARVDNTTLDIHCDLKETVDHVVLSGKGVRHLCSVHISGGRNVALKQYSSQSSTYLGYTPEKAVDGDSEPVFHKGNTCSHTLPGDSNPNLKISFSKLQHVTRYVLYNVFGGFSRRLQGFELRSFGPSMTPVFNYTDRSQHPQQVYTVVPDLVTPPVRLVNVAVSKGERILTLCELEVYGDSACQPGQYGWECEHTCHCAGGQSCFVSTGGCPSGCAAGFMGQDCGTELSNNDNMNLAAIVLVPVFSGVGVLVLVFYRRRQTTKSKTHGDSPIYVSRDDRNEVHGTLSDGGYEIPQVSKSVIKKVSRMGSQEKIGYGDIFGDDSVAQSCNDSLDRTYEEIDDNLVSPYEAVVGDRNKDITPTQSCPEYTNTLELTD